jgi:hypothetical protein
MGKSTISMAMFNSYVTNYQQVILLNYSTRILLFHLFGGSPLPAPGEFSTGVENWRGKPSVAPHFILAISLKA